MSEIKQNLSRLNPTQLIVLAAAQSAQMAPAAPATPPIPNMTTALTAQNTKHDAAKTANDTYEATKALLASQKTERDSTADDLRAQMSLTAKAAMVAAGGDAAMLQAAGYTLASDPQPAPPLTQVLNLAVTMGDDDGALDLTCDPLPGARTYDWQLTTADPLAGPYTTVAQTTASGAKLTGLPSGERVWVRVRGVGPKGPGPWSDPATKIVP